MFPQNFPNSSLETNSLERNSSSMATYEKKQVSPPQVFLNYRGPELRQSFISQLEMALKRSGFNVYVDSVSVRGRDLRDTFYGIEESLIALVIFSKRYTESKWCLDELVKINSQVEKGTLIVFPIYYQLNPSQVKRLDGDFGLNLWNLGNSHFDELMKWKEALHFASSRRGLAFDEKSNESTFIGDIITHVQTHLARLQLNVYSVQTEAKSPGKLEEDDIKENKLREDDDDINKYYYIVGLDHVEKKLDMDSNDTRIIGVVGLPGIGKTTIAMMLYERWSDRFLRKAFLDIRKTSEACLRKTLLELLLGGEVPNVGDDGSVVAALLRTKIFAVLDDVSDKTHLEVLLGKPDWIKKGSKIIITTCDKSLLEGFADDTYVVPGWKDDTAFQLFNYHAFGDQLFSPTSIFLAFSRMFVDYALGHPLTLKLLGKELNGKDEAHWESKLNMVTKRSNVLFTDQLKLSEKQENVFLDIVCFFKSEDEYFVRSLLDSGDPDSTEAVSEVKDLVNRFLITTADGRVKMNVPLYTFSKDIGSPRWLRLGNYKDVIGALMTKKDANNVRGIFLDTSELTRSIAFDSSTFTAMRNLLYMKIYDSCCSRQCKADCKVIFPDGLRFPLVEVRYLHWEKFPFKELPPEFNPKNLVDLRLPYSNIARVWEKEKDTPRLKWVDLSHSSELVDLLALSKAVNLQRLNLEGCTGLEELPVEIQNMKSLVFLNLRGCICLWSLPEMNLSSLKTLILSDCSNVNEFQLVSTSVEFLHLDGTAIRELPQGIEHLRKLVVLNLKNCKRLKCLPICLGNLEALDKLILSGCSRLKNLPDVKNSLKHLQVLLFDNTGAEEMPSISCFTESELPATADLFLQTLGSHCSVREWPCGVNSLRRLCLSGNNFLSLQPDIWKLYNLKWLDVKYCRYLRSVPMLPPRLQYFDAHGCNNLRRVANPIAFPMFSDQSHATFNFSNCNKLDPDAKDNIVSYTRWRSQLVLDELTPFSGGLFSESLIGTCFPGREVPVSFSHRACGSVLKTKLPPHWCDNKFTGIGLCAVVVFDSYHNQGKSVVLKCNCEFQTERGYSNRFSCTFGGWSQPNDRHFHDMSSHVFIGFTNSLDINNIGAEDHEEKCVYTEALIEFEIEDCEVVNCGFSLVYAPEERRNISSDLRTL